MVTKTLRVAVYAIFQRLYGMYPCNFLSFLRKNFADPAFSSANRKVFSDVIQVIPQIIHTDAEL